MIFNAVAESGPLLLRSQLYVPANDERKIKKSVSLECDSIVFDLEDAVPVGEKDNARDKLKHLLIGLDFGEKEVGIRINKVGSGYSSSDLDFFKTEEKISFLVLPKTESLPGNLATKSRKKLFPLVETAKGLLNVEKIARTDGIFALSYGAADFANSVDGKTVSYLENIYVKTKIAITARAYGILPIDNVFFDLSDLEGFRKEAEQSKGLGFAGKQVIHPSQIQVANDVFSPTAEEIDESKRIVEAYEKSAAQKTGALKMNEKLIDAVHYRQAKSLLNKVK